MSGPFPGPEVSHYPVQGEYVEIVEPERLEAELQRMAG
jgi:uncharacterized protein YndB with AHSA1/START domain